MRGFKRHCCTQMVVAGHAFVQNLRRGHYQLGLDVAANQRVVMSFAELTRAM